MVFVTVGRVEILRLYGRKVMAYGKISIGA